MVVDVDAPLGHAHDGALVVHGFQESGDLGFVLRF